MKSIRLSEVLFLGLMFCLLHLDSGGLAEEQAQVTIEATGRAMCEGLPVKNLNVTITLVDSQSGKKYKCKGKTDDEGSFSFNILPGNYECRTVSMGWYNPKRLEGERSKATMIVGHGKERVFSTRDYFNGSKFWTSRKKRISISPESSALPDMEFIPKLEVVQPADGSVIREKVPVFKWESIEGAESYTVIIQGCKPPEEGKGKRWKQVLRREDIHAAEWKPEESLFEGDKLYFVEIEAIGPEGRKINKSKKAEFTVVGKEVKEPQ